MSPELIEKLLKIAQESGQLSREEQELAYEKLTDKANRKVMGIEPEPPLLSDNTFAFGYGDRIQTAVMRILSQPDLDFILPRLMHWVFSLFGDGAMDILRNNRPEVVGEKILNLIKDRTTMDRLKVSVYETLEFLFSNPGHVVTKEFLYVCPHEQKLSAWWKLVETNYSFFQRLWDQTPTPIKHGLYALYLTILTSIDGLSESVKAFVNVMIRGILFSVMSGGPSDSGPDGSADLPESEQENLLKASSENLLLSAS